jgi:hypothetical protein
MRVSTFYRVVQDFETTFSAGDCPDSPLSEDEFDAIFQKLQALLNTLESCSCAQETED